MSTKSGTALLTADEFLMLPDAVHGGRMELVRGKVIVEMPPSGRHGIRALNIGHALRTYVARHRLGVVMVEGGFVLSRHPDTVRAPDVSFLSREMMPPGGIPEVGFILGAPTLAIEVVSPGDTAREVDAKVAEYIAAGTPRVWVVRGADATVTVHRPDGPARILRTGDALNADDAGFAGDFVLPVDDIFRDE